MLGLRHEGLKEGVHFLAAVTDFLVFFRKR